MALSRFVLTATVTLTPDTINAISATPAEDPSTVDPGLPGTGGAAGFGNASTVSPSTSGKFGLWAGTYQAGTVIYADSSAGSSGPQLLYQAIGSGNLRAYVPGQDDRGGAALAN